MVNHDVSPSKSFEFIFNDADKCRYSPLHETDAAYYQIECAQDVAQVEITFPVYAKKVYDSDINELTSLMAYLAKDGTVSTYYVQTCEDVNVPSTCTQHRLDFRRLSSAVPKLAPGGLIFSRYAVTPKKPFDPNRLIYDVTLFSNEPVIITAKAPAGLFVDFSKPTEESENIFVDGSRSITYVPQGSPNTTESLQVWVASQDRGVVTTYTIHVTTVVSTDPRLAAVDVSPGRLDPNFQTRKYSYLYRIPEGTRTVSLTLTAVNNRETVCTLQNAGLAWEKHTARSGFDFSKFFRAGSPFFGNEPEETSTSTTSPHSSQKPHTQMVIKGSGTFTLQVPSHPHSSNILVSCVAQDSEHRVQYVFSVIPQRGGSTRLQDLYVLNGTPNQAFDPNNGGPYIVTTNEHWIRFHALPQNPNARCAVEGKLIDPDSHVSKYFRINLGERHRFRITVTTDTNPVAEEYFVIVDRPAPWYQHAKAATTVGNWFGWVSIVMSSIRTSAFMATAKFLQFLSVTNRVYQTPESYEFFSAAMHKFNLQNFQGHVAKTWLNRTFYAPPDHYSTVLQTMMLPYSQDQHRPSADVNTFDVLRDAMAKLDVLQPAVSNAESGWTKAYPDRVLYKRAVAGALHTQWETLKREAAENDYALHQLTKGGLRRFLLDTPTLETQNQLLQQVDRIYKQQQKAIAFASSIIGTSVLLLAAGCFYIVAWSLYLRDQGKRGFFTLRQDFPRVLRPGKFWSFLFDYAFIAYTQASLGILFMKDEAAITEIMVFGTTVTAQRLAWLALVSLFAVPCTLLIGAAVVLSILQRNLVFSSIFQRYHQAHVDNVKARQTHLDWIPILSQFLTMEITSIMPVTKLTPRAEPNGPAQEPLEFSEDARSFAPWFLGNPNDVTAAEHNPDIEAAVGSDGYKALIPTYEGKTTIKHRTADDALKVQLHPEAYDKRLESFDPALYARFPRAVVGYTNYKLKNAYDHRLNVEVAIQLRHLPALMNIRSYAVWVPYDNLQQDQADNWNHLFGAAPKGNVYSWLMDRCIMAVMLLFLSGIDDPSGLIHAGVWSAVCTLAAIAYMPSVFATATSKWFQLMSKEALRLQHEEFDLVQTAAEQRVWPYHKLDVKESFAKLYTRKRDLETWGLYSFCRRYISQPIAFLISLDFWKTRFWLTTREVLCGPCGNEIMKALMLLLLVLSNTSLHICGNSSAIIWTSIITMATLVLLNVETISDWRQQLRVTFVELRSLLLSAIISVGELIESPRTVLPRFTHFMQSLQRVIQGEQGVCFGYPRFTGEKVRELRVDNVIIISNELGTHLPGKIRPDRNMKRLAKSMDWIDSGRCDLYKTLHIYGAVGAHRPELLRTMPVQMPFKQFFQAGKGQEQANMLRRLACTVQIVNYNESRGTSGYGHTAEDDSFFSLYSDPLLLPEYGKVRGKHLGHGYVVRWLPDKEMIVIRGPGIKGEQEYYVVSVDQKPPSDDDDFEKMNVATIHSGLSSIELPPHNQQGGATASSEAICTSSGILYVSLAQEEVPDLHKKIEITAPNGDKFEVQPTEVKVEYYEYAVGRTRRREMLLRSRHLIASEQPYTVEWTIRRRGRKLNATARSPADGVLYVPWRSTEAPDLRSYITLRNETEGSALEGSVIDIDPRDTDAHQFFLPPAQPSSGIRRLVTSAAHQIAEWSRMILGTSPTDSLVLDPIPCTVVQCVNPVERKFRVEPNFNEAMLVTKAKIEQLMGLKKDLTDNAKLGHLWADFMSTKSFIKFWEDAGISLVIRGAWINPLTNAQHVYIKERSVQVANATLKFRDEIERRIDNRISQYASQYAQYSIWNKAFNDNDMYAALLLRDRIEWADDEACQSLQGRLAALQTYKQEYAVKLPNFQFPITVDAAVICRRDKCEAQLRLWREELCAWLFQCEGASVQAEQGGKSCAQAVVDDVIRAVERTVKRVDYAAGGAYRTVLHYVTSACATRGRDRNWRPDPLAAHFAMIRLFRGYEDDVSRVDWQAAVWTPCFLKLAGDRIMILFPHENDALAEEPEYYEEDITKRFSWNQLQAYYIPLECFERMCLSLDPSISKDPHVPDELRSMHAKLVLRKATEYYVDDAYVKNVFGNEFIDEVLYGQDIKSVLKIRLCNTVSNKVDGEFNPVDKFYHGDRCSVLPLTFRFHPTFFHKWQSAIRLAEMYNPRKDVIHFDGHTGLGSDESISDGGSSEEYVPPLQPRAPSSGSSSFVSSSVSSESLTDNTLEHKNSSSSSSSSKKSQRPQRQESSKSSMSKSTESEKPAVTRAPSDSPTDLAVYEGGFENFRFSGKDGRLYDNSGKLVYAGDWVEGQRWGHGHCFFTDSNNLQWEFDGDFIADEMRRGRLTMVDPNEIQRLRNSRNTADRYAIVSYEGSFRLPDVATGPQRSLVRMNSNCVTRAPPKLHPSLLSALFDTKQDSGETRQQLVIDIRRAISACADDATWNATTAWAQDNYGREYATKFGQQSSFKSTASNEEELRTAIEEYLPHRSRWIRLLDPNAGYQSLGDRFAHGVVVFADGSRYRGEMKAGRPDGVGMLYCPQCNLKYNGYWKAGYPHGYGALMVGDTGTPERMEYYGDFRHGTREGRGIQLSRNGKIVIKGDFKDDVLDGPHCVIDIASDLASSMSHKIQHYVGGMQKGLFHGKGKLIWTDGTTYKGTFAEGLRSGDGVIRDEKNKTVVAGEWEKDFPNGRLSVLVLPDGSVYTGDVKNGQRQGMGEVFHKGVPHYEGLWINDLPNGRGTLYAPDGVYEGEFRAGKRHGKGRFEFKDKPLSNGKLRVYEGDWKNDRPDGTGRYLNELGVENAYKFKDGELVASSAKAYKSGMCGKAPTLGSTFVIQPAAVTAHDPKYWGLKRKISAEDCRAVSNLGRGVWKQHMDKDFKFMDPSEAEGAHHTAEDEEIPKPPILQQISSGSVDSLNDKRDIIQITVESASNLDPPSPRKIHPYCRVRLGRVMKRTKPINAAGSNPKWASTLNFPKTRGWAEFEVWDKDPLGPDLFVGSAEYNVYDLLASGKESHEVHLRLTRQNNQIEAESGMLHVKFHLTHCSLVPSTDGASTEFKGSFGSVDVCKVHVKGFKNLYKTEPSEKVDLYFIFYVGDNREETRCVENLDCKEGTLDLTCEIPYNNEEQLRIEARDKDAFGNDQVIGLATLRLAGFKAGEVELKRHDKNQKREVPAGKVNLEITVESHV